MKTKRQIACKKFLYCLKWLLVFGVSTNVGLRYVDTAHGFSGCLLAATVIVFY